MNHDPARTRTWNPLIRSQMPYPLGHRACHWPNFTGIISLANSLPRNCRVKDGLFCSFIKWCVCEVISRNSSVGRALDWRSKDPWFKTGELNQVLNYPGFRQCLLFKSFFWIILSNSLQPITQYTLEALEVHCLNKLPLCCWK